MNLEEITVMTPKKFAIKIETIVAQGGVSYMDAILDYCEKNQMEPDSIAPLISKPQNPWNLKIIRNKFIEMD